MKAFRLARIFHVIIKHGLDEFLYYHPYGRWIYPLAPWNWFKRWRKKSAPSVSRETRIRLALEDLGPIFIKLGQTLSTRPDLIPPALVKELTYLQDRVPPFENEAAKALIEQALGKPTEEIFQHFEKQPLASASIAQVHAATLKNGRQVVVKVVRPTIEPVIRHDIELLYVLAQLMQRYHKDGVRLRPVEVIQEYEKTILDELDLVHEAANASQLHRNFADSTDLYIPEIYWDYCQSNVIVMERIYGVPIGDIETLQAHHVNMKRLSERGVEIFFTQVFRHNFFHADMHPGNIFVDISDPNDPKYLAVDFGIVGSLSPDDQRYLAENFHAFFNRDYKRVAELHVESGWIPADTRVDEFEAAIRTVCEPIFQQPIAEISFGNLLLRLFQTARRFDMEVQPQLVLLQKTMLNIEGLGRQLYPDLDLWVTAKPFIQRWMDEQVGVRALWKGAKLNIPKILENIPYAPNLIFELIEKTNNSQLKINYESRQINALRQEIKSTHQKRTLSLIGACLLMASLIALLVGPDTQNQTQSFFTWFAGIIGSLLLLFSLF
ncbi:MAG: ubiquinone biosynthesis regulatory protein kinase UbiB [bacterium]